MARVTSLKPNLGLSQTRTPSAQLRPAAPASAARTIPNYNNAQNNFVSLNPAVNKYAQQAVGFNQSPYAKPASSGGGAAGGAAGGAGGGGDSQLEILAKTDRNPSQEAEYQGLLEQQQGTPEIDWDALIAPHLQSLDQAEQAAAGYYQAGTTETEGARVKGAATTKQSIGEQEQTLAQGRNRQQQLGQSAMDEARQQFAEIQQGLQGRYGKSTGTGAFATELAGRQSIKNIGGIRQGLQNAMLEIDTGLQKVKEIGRIALEDIETKSQADKEKLKANLDSSLAQIRGEKGQLQQWKASKAAEAIQNYRSEANAIQQRNMQFKQQLAMNQLQREQQLQDAMKRAKGVAESFTLRNLTNAQGVNTPVRQGNKGTVLDFQGNQVNVGAGDTMYNPAGLTPPKNEEELEDPFA